MSKAPRENIDIPCEVDVVSGSLAAYDTETPHLHKKTTRAATSNYEGCTFLS
jgi:hypothetical protein